ncbi:4-hydroxy-tetrahydrodipicolinate synthase [Ruegeria halocynthiae]|uniref:4-hydroxy-tetrahydrodipicolinate synthase n=1 Tax=Ruegeria halocynthiae TaxID=985054 RepID=A0A1H2YZ60_9RHOB|nr:hypothetical protein [Ruegeria halocynthiae]SDX10460.1 4-hydroxy-tetrahydrodipicolinate synthase [Ruegeria halocynthiae]
MPGTGLRNLEDTVTLTRHASELGCAAVTVLGAGGCISASRNSNITAIRVMYEAVRDGDQSEADTLQQGPEIHCKAAQEEGLIGGLKSLVAHRSNDRH